MYVKIGRDGVCQRNQSEDRDQGQTLYPVEEGTPLGVSVSGADRTSTSTHLCLDACTIKKKKKTDKATIRDEEEAKEKKTVWLL